MYGAFKISDPKLNTLCYQILGVLLRQPRSGYDIVKQLENIRPVKTSQVYPTLARLEKDGLVVSIDVAQEGRPNKRVYSPTEAGKQELTQWIGQEPEPPVLRDDFLTMIYSGWVKEPAEVIAMFERRIKYLHSIMEQMEGLLAALMVSHPDSLKDPRDWHFYRHILLARRLTGYQQEVIWSRSVINQLQDAAPPAI